MGEPVRQLLLEAAGRFLYALLVDTASGLLAGAVLAGGFCLFGGIAGAMYGCLAGLMLGVTAAIRMWPTLSIYVACGAQLIGALTVGFGMTWVDPRSGPPDHAIAGMLGGGAVGIVLAEVVRYLTPCAVAETDGPACPQCGYSLRGNVSGTCPECGRPVGDKDSVDGVSKRGRVETWRRY